MSQHYSDVMGKANIGLRECVPQEKIKLTRPTKTEGRTFLQDTSQLREGDLSAKTLASHLSRIKYRHISDGKGRQWSSGALVPALRLQGGNTLLLYLFSSSQDGIITIILPYVC